MPTVGANQGFTAIQNYNYDSLNRIKDATENSVANGQSSSSQTWKQTFNYDRFGNRTFDTANNNTTTLAANCPTNVCNPSANVANNRLTGASYDSSGNTTTDAENRSFGYDAENKQTEVKNSSGQSVGQYIYDGDGKRIKKKSALEETIFVYDAGGKMVAEYSTQIETTNAKTSYLTSDNLGTPRISSDQTGAVISRHDYQPFGEEAVTAQRVSRSDYQGDAVRNQFTSYQKDAETDLDFAQARMYANKLGRFTTVDPTFGSIKIENPQTLNRYIYALNNPLSFIDPDGQEPVIVGDWSKLTEDQQRLFISYVQNNYADRLGDWTPEAFARNVWNASATSANSQGSDSPQSGTSYFPFLQQSQLTTFVGVTSMLEHQQVIGEVTSVTTINGNTPEHEFRIFGELKNNASIKKIEKAFDNGGLIGSGTNFLTPAHGEYSISRREQGPNGQPNGQVSRIPNMLKVDIDVDYGEAIAMEQKPTIFG